MRRGFTLCHPVQASSSERDTGSRKAKCQQAFCLSKKELDSVFRRNDDQGFTLIEISIVLVIIGLLVGGVLVGRDLIEAASIRSQISQIESFKLAARTFELKYDCTAGDCPNAAQLGFRAPNNSLQDGGNGDGILSNHNSWWYDAEQFNFWYQLSDAGLIPGQYTGWTTALSRGDQGAVIFPPDDYMPKAKISGGYVHVAGSTGEYKNVFVLFKPNNLSGVFNYNQLLSVPQAYAIDSKMDDGKANSGKVLGSMHGNTIDIPVSAAAAAVNGIGVVVPLTIMIFWAIGMLHMLLNQAPIPIALKSAY